MPRFCYVFVLCLLQLCHGGPPKVETNVMLLDSYIPAAMQVIAHLTESMKYDLRPPSSSMGPSSARPSELTKPTSTHRPGVYAPEVPPGPESYEKLGELGGYPEEAASSKTFFTLPKLQAYLNVETEELPENLENLIGFGPAALVKLVNSEDAPASSDPDEQVQIFSKNFDDSEFIRVYLEKNKKAPPTRAYVTLLSLYDQLSKDAKSQGFNKFQGYHQHVLVELSKTSSGTSVDQLRFVLEKIMANQDTKQPQVTKKISTLLEEMKTENSYIHKALLYIPPLQFSL